MHKIPRQKGFTVIELMLVVVILCVLSALVALTASGVQAKNRNADRQTDIDAVRLQLEGLYAGTDTYPTLADLNNAAWRTKHLPKLSEASLSDPKWDKTEKTCSTNGKVVLADKPTVNCYSYQVTASDGSACNNVKAPCVHYTLTASLEGGEKYVKSSLN